MFSMLGHSLFREFEEDDFFGFPRGHRMMDFGFHNPALGFSGDRQRASNLDTTNRRNDLVPFGMHDDRFPFGDVFKNMRKMMSDMQGSLNANFAQSHCDPNAHSFSQSSYMSYSNVGNGAPPKIYQAMTSTKTAPGGIKETKRAVRDSDKGFDKMAIGRHIHDRGHMMQRTRNTRTNEEESHQNFMNMDENDAQAFESEWQVKTRPWRSAEYHRKGARHQIGNSRNGSRQLCIEGKTKSKRRS